MTQLPNSVKLAYRCAIYHSQLLTAQHAEPFAGASTGIADVDVAMSIGMRFGFLVVCLTFVWRVFKTEYKIRH